MARMTKQEKCEREHPRYPEYLRYVAYKQRVNETVLPFPEWHGKRLLLDQFQGKTA